METEFETQLETRIDAAQENRPSDPAHALARVKRAEKGLDSPAKRPEGQVRLARGVCEFTAGRRVRLGVTEEVGEGVFELTTGHADRVARDAARAVRDQSIQPAGLGHGVE